MNFDTWRMFEQITWIHVAGVLAVWMAARLVAAAARRLLRGAAESASPRRRLGILRAIPLVRLAIALAAAMAAVPMLIEPSFRNVAALLAAVGLALAFALKDYASSVIGGLTTVLENVYQPGDWIEIDGIYGEVRQIDARAVRLVTADDTEVIVPHSRLWSSSIANATGGSRQLLCVAEFYLHPDHDGAAARQRLTDVALASPRRQPESKVTVVAKEKPWGTQYRVKAYVHESREQFLFVTDLTVAGKDALRKLGVRFAIVPYAVK